MSLPRSGSVALLSAFANCDAVVVDYEVKIDRGEISQDFHAVASEWLEITALSALDGRPTISKFTEQVRWWGLKDVRELMGLLNQVDFIGLIVRSPVAVVSSASRGYWHVPSSNESHPFWSTKIGKGLTLRSHRAVVDNPGGGISAIHQASIIARQAPIAAQNLFVLWLLTKVHRNGFIGRHGNLEALYYRIMTYLDVGEECGNYAPATLQVKNGESTL